MEHLLLIGRKALKFSQVDGKRHNFCEELRKGFLECWCPSDDVELKASDDVSVAFDPVLRCRELDIKDDRYALLRGVLGRLTIAKIAQPSICTD